MIKNIFLKQAVILAGGYGKRLGKITEKVPKPLIKIDGENTFIDYQIRYLNQFDFDEILILCSYKYEIFKKKYHNKKILNTKIYCIKEKGKLGTGGALLNARKYLKDIFFICNGDTFFDLNLTKLFFKFKKTNKTIIALNLNQEKKKIKRIILKGVQKSFTNEVVNKNEEYFNSGYGIIKKKDIKEFLLKNSNLELDIYNKLLKKKKIKFIKFNEKLIDYGTKKELKNLISFTNKYKKRFVLLLDRDGVINVDYGYINDFSKIKFNKKIFKIIQVCNELRIPVFVITNQSGIARNYFTEDKLLKINRQMKNYFLKKNIYVSHFYYCPHHVEGKIRKYKINCNCRKPKIGLFNRLKKDWFLEPKKSLMLGDKLSDKNFADKIKSEFLYVKNNKIRISTVINKIKRNV
jgi:D,D-heptose 1,7-bisphosphate phosphatase